MREYGVYTLYTYIRIRTNENPLMLYPYCCGPRGVLAGTGAGAVVGERTRETNKMLISRRRQRRREHATTRGPRKFVVKLRAQLPTNERRVCTARSFYLGNKRVLYYVCNANLYRVQTVKCGCVC